MFTISRNSLYRDSLYGGLSVYSIRTLLLFTATSQKEEAQIVHRIHKQHGNTRCICMKIEYGLNQSHVLFLSK